MTNTTTRPLTAGPRALLDQIEHCQEVAISQGTHIGYLVHTARLRQLDALIRRGLVVPGGMTGSGWGWYSVALIERDHDLALAMNEPCGYCATLLPCAFTDTGACTGCISQATGSFELDRDSGSETPELTTGQLHIDDVVHEWAGLRVRLVRCFAIEQRGGRTVYAWDGIVTNRDEVPDGVLPYAWTSRPDGTHRWIVQGNDDVTWTVTRKH